MHLSAEEISRARERLLVDGFCVVDGGLTPGRIEAWQEWSDQWLGSMKQEKVPRCRGRMTKFLAKSDNWSLDNNLRNLTDQCNRTICV